MPAGWGIRQACATADRHNSWQGSRQGFVQRCPARQKLKSHAGMAVNMRMLGTHCWGVQAVQLARRVQHRTEQGELSGRCRPGSEDQLGVFACLLKQCFCVSPLGAGQGRRRLFDSTGGAEGSVQKLFGIDLTGH